MNPSPTSVAAVLLPWLAAGTLVAQEAPVEHRETPEDSWLPPRSPVPDRPGGGSAGAGAGGAVQVNVSADGANILNDAGNEPSIAVDPTAPNRMVIGWRQFDNVASNFRQAGWAYSHDGGRTWTFPGRIQAGTFRSDPVLAADPDGTFYYCSLRGDFAVHFFLSFDGGVTWGAQLPAAQVIGGDKQWFDVDRTGGVGDGNIYLNWNQAAGCCGGNTFSRSIDTATSFQTPLFMFGQPRFGNSAVSTDGAIYIGGALGQNFGTFLVIRSSNARNPLETPTFDIAEPVDLGGSMVLGAGPNPGGLLGQANIAVDTSFGPNHGNVYLLCSVNPPGPDPLDVMFARSEDGGLTWSEPTRVNDDVGEAWQWFGTMSVAPDGRIDVVWNDGRNSAAANVTETFYAFSEDGGDTWSANVPLTDPWNSFVGYPNQSKIGDYYDMDSDALGADLAFATTLNGEQDVYYLRIGPRDCNRNEVDDDRDLATGTSFDCNANAIPDECEIAAGTETDEDGNGLIDSCECAAADLDGSGSVDTVDFLALLAAWGTDPGGPPDLNADGTVDTLDLLSLLAQWGPC